MLSIIYPHIYLVISTYIHNISDGLYMSASLCIPQSFEPGLYLRKNLTKQTLHETLQLHLHQSL